MTRTHLPRTRLVLLGLTALVAMLAIGALLWGGSLVGTASAQPPDPDAPPPVSDGECGIVFTSIPYNIPLGETKEFRWRYENVDVGTLIINSPDPKIARITDSTGTSVSMRGESRGIGEITLSALCVNEAQKGQRIGVSSPVVVDDADTSEVNEWPPVDGDDTGQQEENSPDSEVTSALVDVALANESATHEVSLTGVFSDSDGDDLTVTATSSDANAATVSVSADYSALTVSAQARGTATITVTADDGNGGSFEDSFIVKVKAAPVFVAQPWTDLVGLELGLTIEIGMLGAFSDADEDALTITSSSSDEAVATVSVSADYSTLAVAGVAEGTATITVTA